MSASLYETIKESEAAAAVRELARKFAKQEMLPSIETDEASETFRPEWIEKLGSLGLTGVPVDEAYGGAGLGYSEYIAVIEEIAAVSASYAISLAVTGLPQVILSEFGSLEQKSKWISPLAKGKEIGSFALSEAGSGSDAGALRTTATLKGDHYVLNGTKLWCTQGDVASTLLVLARTGVPGPKGISALAVRSGTPGFSLGKREKKMGLHCSHTMELIFNECLIPKSSLVGEEGQGFSIAMRALDSGRITIAATALGIARSALELAISHAKTREQFGKKILEFQGVSFLLADMAVQLEAARLLVQKAAALKDQGQPFSQAAAMAKVFATDAAMKITTDAVQVLGGSGYTQDFAAERWMREAKVLQIVEGTNQIQRLVIGRGL